MSTKRELPPLPDAHPYVFMRSYSVGQLTAYTRAAIAAQAPSPAKSFDALRSAIRKFPMVRASEIDGEESDGTPISWRNRPFVSLTQLERLLEKAESVTPSPVAPPHSWEEAEQARFFGVPETGIPVSPPVAPSEPTDDLTAVELWAEIWRLREALKGPTGFATWQDAATDERIRRVKAESALRAAIPDEKAEPVGEAALTDLVEKIQMEAYAEGRKDENDAWHAAIKVDAPTAEEPVECPVCHGTKRVTEECEHCCGTGTVWPTADQVVQHPRLMGGK